MTAQGTNYDIAHTIPSNKDVYGYIKSFEGKSVTSATYNLMLQIQISISFPNTNTIRMYFDLAPDEASVSYDFKIQAIVIIIDKGKKATMI